MSIQLTVMSLDFETSVAPSTKVYEKQEITLGRSEDNDVVLDLPEVSGKHAKLTARVSEETGEPQLFLTDLGSSNGTLVENNLVQRDSEVPLSPHERIKIGRFLIKPYLNASEFGSEDDVKTFEIELSTTKDSEDTLEQEFFNEETSRQVETTLLTNSNGIHSEDREELASFDEITEIEEEDEEIVETSEAEKELLYSSVIDSFDDEEESGSEIEEEAVEEFLETSIPVANRASQVEPSTVSGSLTDDILDLNFVALEILDLKGSVLHKGAPLAGVTVDAGELGFTTTDENGQFTFANIPEDTNFELSFEKDKYKFSSGTISGQIGDGQSIRIAATKLYSLSGQVIHRGKPLDGVTIDGGELGTVTTNSDGRYTFDNIPEDTEYTLTASKDGFLIGQQTIKQ